MQSLQEHMSHKVGDELSSWPLGWFLGGRDGGLCATWR